MHTRKVFGKLASQFGYAPAYPATLAVILG
jgi:hypothetical protein